MPNSNTPNFIFSLTKTTLTLKGVYKPTSGEFLTTLKNHRRKKEKPLAHYPKAIVAAMNIISRLISVKKELTKNSIPNLPTTYADFTATNFEESFDLNIDQSNYSRGKLALKELGFITLPPRRAIRQTDPYDGGPVLNNKGKPVYISPPSLYVETSKLYKTKFEEEETDFDITIRDVHNIPIEVDTTQKNTLMTPLELASKIDKDGSSWNTEPFKNKGFFQFKAAKVVRLPTDEMFSELYERAKVVAAELTAESATKAKPRTYTFSPDSTKDHTIRNTFLFIDLLKQETQPRPFIFYDTETAYPTGYKKHEPPFLPDKFLDDLELSQKHLQELMANYSKKKECLGDGSTDSVNVVKLILLGEQQHTGANRTKNANRSNGLGWVEISKNYQVPKTPQQRKRDWEKKYGRTTTLQFDGIKGRSDSFRFTGEFFPSYAEHSASQKCFTINNQNLWTNYDVLHRTTLHPDVFTKFDEIAKIRNWKVKVKSQQRGNIQNYEYDRGKTFHNNENSRITTTQTLMAREFREFLLIDGEETVEIDIRSAHAMFIAHTDEFKQFPKERREWLALVRSKTGIYELFIKKFRGLGEKVDSPEPNQTPRDSFKVIFNSYINGGGKDAFDKALILKTDFRDFMAEHFPVLNLVINTMLLPISKGGYSTIKEWRDQQKQPAEEEYNRNGSSIRLMEIESEIMGTHWMCNGDIDCISVHDGLLCKKSDASRLKKAVMARAKTILGFNLKVTTKKKSFHK